MISYTDELGHRQDVFSAPAFYPGDEFAISFKIEHQYGIVAQPTINTVMFTLALSHPDSGIVATHNFDSIQALYTDLRNLPDAPGFFQYWQAWIYIIVSDANDSRNFSWITITIEEL